MKAIFNFIVVFPLLAIPALAQNATNISDASITRYIQQRYERDPYLFSPQLNVETTAGRVTVSGDVGTVGEEFRALELAGATRGVRDVVDRINVIATNRPDSELRMDVRAAFGRDRAVEGREINVGVTNGIVVLTGTVDSLVERDLALNITRFVPGVRGIENQIRVQPTKQRSDEDIAADIRALLRLDPRLEGTPLTVNVKDGRADISGIVLSPTQRAIAAALAQVQGVRDVNVSRVQISPQGIDAGIRAQTAERQPVRARDSDSETPGRTNGLASAQRDAAIQQAMTVYLSAHPYIDVRNVKVRMQDGTAHLEGTIGTLSQRNQVIDALRNLGVTRIVDQLQIRTATPTESPDVDTRQRLRAQFGADPYLSDDRIDVSVLDGRVQLGGTVDSVQEKYRATTIASGTAGVRQVLNSLQVPSQKYHLSERTPEQGGGVTIIPFDDDESRLRDRVRDQLVFDPFIDGSRVRITVENAAVILAGTVKSEWARQRAIRNAYEAGARQVVDQLRIAP